MAKVKKKYQPATGLTRADRQRDFRQEIALAQNFFKMKSTGSATADQEAAKVKLLGPVNRRPILKKGNEK